MARKRPGKEDSKRSSYLANDSFLTFLMELLRRTQADAISRNRLAEMMELDTRSLKNAMEGKGIYKSSAESIAEALSNKLIGIIKEHGGPDELKKELISSMEWDQIARSFQWLTDRLEGKPPYIVSDDLIINRDGRHLVDQYNISLAVAPHPGGTIDIEYS